MLLLFVVRIHVYVRQTHHIHHLVLLLLYLSITNFILNIIHYVETSQILPYEFCANFTYRILWLNITETVGVISPRGSSMHLLLTLKTTDATMSTGSTWLFWSGEFIPSRCRYHVMEPVISEVFPKRKLQRTPRIKLLGYHTITTAHRHYSFTLHSTSHYWRCAGSLVHF